MMAKFHELHFEISSPPTVIDKFAIRRLLPIHRPSMDISERKKFAAMKKSSAKLPILKLNINSFTRLKIIVSLLKEVELVWIGVCGF